MQYETEAARSLTLAENLQRGHRVASEIEQCLLSIDSTLTGCGATTNASGANAPSSGLLGDAYSLADRLERIMSAVHILANAISAPPNVIDYNEGRLQSKAEAEAMYRAQSQAAGQVLGGRVNY